MLVRLGRTRIVPAIGQAFSHVGLDHQPVHDQIDAVPLIFGQFRHGVQRHDSAVHPDSGETLRFELLEKVGVRALLVNHQRSQKQKLRSLGQIENPSDDFVAGQIGRAHV